MALTGRMFTATQQIVDAPLGIAQSRLVTLMRGDWLRKASDEAYQRSADDLLRVGPFGGKPGSSRLVRVQFTDPAYSDDAMRVGLRWEAIGMTGGLFPALDADLVLTSDGDRTRAALTGSYRPPLGVVGAGLDRLVLRKIAAATMSAFLDQVSRALTDTQAPAAEASRR